jgi:uncharacterized membrane protein SirB2
MIYIKMKMLHTLLALVSISGFALRGYWMLSGSEWLNRRATRIFPHIIDALLLAVGIWLVWSLAVNPFTKPWLLAKFTGLFVYIALGMVALKRGRTRQIRLIAFISAIAVFIYIIGVAVAKSPFSWLAAL